ncbi:heme exporter protein CcmD [Polynucleobacter sp. AP-Nino-20-G2]|uniref:heme exporter protein CcmD n=1 Tax=Polynucleobacter sp. AP-Nino-20-G2 TaxID=2576917 RepID=UPI001BFE022E|nr:heme exporter protein CcmD [Polynucleobacter sp. AP-Nino-20-G2]QWE16193.1 heme exporter protein CcmD [Polynucleobacter sp. AP-Nino-20-G2]
MWNSPAEFFEMGGYALYVWCSFGVCALVLLLEPMAVRVRHQSIVRRLRREVRAEQFDQESRK